MTGLPARGKWDFSAGFYDLLAWGTERRWAPFKRQLFANMRGRVLFAAIGTGQDIPFFPPGKDVIGIDISPRMLAKAKARAARYDGVRGTCAGWRPGASLFRIFTELNLHIC